MSYSEVVEFDKAMTMIECREDLLASNVAAFPHKKEAKQKSYIKKLEIGMKSGFERGDQPQSTEEIYESLLRKLGNG